MQPMVNELDGPVGSRQRLDRHHGGGIAEQGRVSHGHLRFGCDLARSAFSWFESYQAACVSLYDQVWTTGRRLTCLMPAMMRSLSSCFEVTRMWRRTERANLEKKPSTRLSQEPCLGVKVNSKRPAGHVASHALVSLEMWAE